MTNLPILSVLPYAMVGKSPGHSPLLFDHWMSDTFPNPQRTYGVCLTVRK